MKYQVLKSLKTKSKLIRLCDTLQEAKDTLVSLNAHFCELSYVGQFPVYSDNKHTYSIQGLHDHLKVMLSLSKDDLATYK